MVLHYTKLVCSHDVTVTSLLGWELALSGYCKDRQGVSMRCCAYRSHEFTMMIVVKVYYTYLDRMYFSLSDDTFFILIIWELKNL